MQGSGTEYKSIVFRWTYELICEEKKSLLDCTIASINKSLNNPHVLFSDDHSLQRKRPFRLDGLAWLLPDENQIPPGRFESHMLHKERQ